LPDAAQFLIPFLLEEYLDQGIKASAAQLLDRSRRVSVGQPARFVATPHSRPSITIRITALPAEHGKVTQTRRWP